MSSQSFLVDGRARGEASPSSTTTLRKAGSVALTFKDSFEPQVIPDAVYNLLVPSWLTDDIVEPAMLAQFDVL